MVTFVNEVLMPTDWAASSWSRVAIIARPVRLRIRFHARMNRIATTNSVK